MVLHLPRYGERTPRTTRMRSLVHLTRRRVEVPLGRQPRRAPRGVLQTRIRRGGMGRRDGADAVERGGHPKGRQPPLRRADLRQPAGDLRPQGGRGRLARRRDAHPALGLGHLQAPQRGGILPPLVHAARNVGGTRGLHQLRRRLVVLLPLGERPLRGILEEFAQHRLVRYHPLPERRGRKRRGRGGLPQLRRLVPRGAGHVPPAGHLPHRLAHLNGPGAGPRPACAARPRRRLCRRHGTHRGRHPQPRPEARQGLYALLHALRQRTLFGRERTRRWGDGLGRSGCDGGRRDHPDRSRDAGARRPQVVGRGAVALHARRAAARPEGPRGGDLLDGLRLLQGRDPRHARRRG